MDSSKAWQFPEVERWNELHAHRRILSDFLAWEYRTTLQIPIDAAFRTITRNRLMRYFRVDREQLDRELAAGAREIE